MEYILKNGKLVIIRRPVVDDAEELISVISTADKETLFLWFIKLKNNGRKCV